MTTRTVDNRAVPVAGKWEIDKSHTTIEAVARHLMVSKVRGGFTEFSGTIEIADRPEDSSVTVTIDTASIDTGGGKRDGHLKSPDFLDVENYPTLDFRSTSVEAAGSDRWNVTGDLTIRGTTRPVVLDVTFEGVLVDPFGQTKAVFSAATELNREDFGMVWNAPLEAGGVLVGKTLKINLEIQGTLQG